MYCKWKIAMAAALLFPGLAFAGEEDPRACCAYVMEQGQAQRDLLRTPTSIVDVTQPETELPMQLVGGASLGLSDFRKAGLNLDVARKNCELYRAATGAQLEIQYALPSLEKEALLNRLNLIQQASNSLDALIEQTLKMLEAQYATRLMLFNLQTTKIKLEADRGGAQSKFSAIYVPQLSDQSLKELVARKQSSEDGVRKAYDKLSRQNN